MDLVEAVFLVKSSYRAVFLPHRTMDLIDAVGRGDTDKVKQLLSDGRYDVNSQDPEFGRAPLHIAVLTSNADMVKLLLDSGAKVNPENAWGSTPLHEAALHGHEDVVKLLLEHGADPNITDKYGWAPLHGAAYGGHEDTVKLLLEHGADPNITNKVSDILCYINKVPWR
ncbi:tankyrase-1 [Lingula anatina]|uniref:Tankyrase-1 n=1 Tax=Lingula anatina TaxID=7574 RepID=A0A1S3J7M7_LINAN|nr:tankyrase-1 [Lingula anatina]|eukprot:XP_013406236.1 tankyrase-1 [Lingula anatina]